MVWTQLSGLWRRLKVLTRGWGWMLTLEWGGGGGWGHTSTLVIESIRKRYFPSLWSRHHHQVYTLLVIGIHSISLYNRERTNCRTNYLTNHYPCDHFPRLRLVAVVKSPKVSNYTTLVPTPTTPIGSSRLHPPRSSKWTYIDCLVYLIVLHIPALRPLS